MDDSPPPLLVGVPELELRQRFAPLLRRAERGALTIVVLEPADKLAPDAAQQAPGTLSQMVSFREPGCDNQVALAHRYLKPDGTIGGSGRPDPKLVLQDGILYGQQRKRQPR